MCIRDRPLSTKPPQLLKSLLKSALQYRWAIKNSAAVKSRFCTTAALHCSELVGQNAGSVIEQSSGRGIDSLEECRTLRNSTALNDLQMTGTATRPQARQESRSHLAIQYFIKTAMLLIISDELLVVG